MSPVYGVDPRTCPERHEHADQKYGDRWEDASPFGNRYPRIDGRSIAKTYKQTRCSGCNLYMIWTPRAIKAQK